MYTAILVYLATHFDKFYHTVNDIQKRVDENRHLVGIIFLFCCVTAKGQSPLPGLEAALELVYKSFSSLGYLVVRVAEDASSRQIKQYVQVASKIKYPESYHHIGVYFTGHGKLNAVCTTDGELPIKDIVTPFAPDRCPPLKNLIKFFIIDACRDSDSDNAPPEDFTQENCCVIFPTLPHRRAFYDEHSKGTKCGKFTRAFMKQICQENRSFLDIVRDMRQTVVVPVLSECIVAPHSNNLLKNSVGTCKLYNN